MQTRGWNKKKICKRRTRRFSSTLVASRHYRAAVIYIGILTLPSSRGSCKNLVSNVYRRWWCLPQAPITRVSLPPTLAHSKTLLYPSSLVLYGYIHPESIGRSGYNATNPNCSETFQIPLDVSSEVKHREGFPTGPSHSSGADCIRNK